MGHVSPVKNRCYKLYIDLGTRQFCITFVNNINIYYFFRLFENKRRGFEETCCYPWFYFFLFIACFRYPVFLSGWMHSCTGVDLCCFYLLLVRKRPSSSFPFNRSLDEDRFLGEIGSFLDSFFLFKLSCRSSGLSQLHEML